MNRPVRPPAGLVTDSPARWSINTARRSADATAAAAALADAAAALRAAAAAVRAGKPPASPGQPGDPPGRRDAEHGADLPAEPRDPGRRWRKLFN